LRHRGRWSLCLGGFNAEHDSWTMRAALAGSLALNIDGPLHGTEAGLGIKGHPAVEAT
jgi:hypothetical protein